MAKIRQIAGTLLRTPRAAMLARRRKRWLDPINHYRIASDIPTLAPAWVYRRFISSFVPQTVGAFKIQMRKHAGDAPVAVAYTRWVKRKIGDTIRERYRRYYPTAIIKAQAPVPSNPFKMPFNLGD